MTDTEKQLEEAIRLLAYWIHCVKNKGTSWDNWDEAYKDAAFKPTQTSIRWKINNDVKTFEEADSGL